MHIADTRCAVFGALPETWHAALRHKSKSPESHGNIRGLTTQTFESVARSLMGNIADAYSYSGQLRQPYRCRALRTVVSVRKLQYNTVPDRKTRKKIRDSFLASSQGFTSVEVPDLKIDKFPHCILLGWCVAGAATHHPSQP